MKTTLAFFVLVPLLFGAANSSAQLPPPHQGNVPPAVAPVSDWDLAQLAFADDPRPPAGQGQRGLGRNGRRGPADMEQRRKFLDQLRILKLLEVLNLREDQEPKFMQAFVDMQRKQRQIEQARAAIIDSLAQELKVNKIGEKQVDGVVARLTSLGAERVQITTDFVTSMRQLLTPEQLGRLIVFQDRFELELLERVRGFRARMQGGNQPEDSAGYPGEDQ